MPLRYDAGDMRKRFLLASLLLLGSSASPVAAQRYAEFEARLKLIFDKMEYDADEPRDFRWMPDGASYSVTGPPPDGGSKILVCGIATGRCAEKVKISVAIESYEWSPDGKKLLVFTNSIRNWASENSTYARRGDYWLVDAATGDSRKIGADAKASTLMFAKFSPDSRRIAYVRESDLYVEDLASRRTRRLTRDGSSTLLNGRADWVYEEELALAEGYRWSPDSRRIAFLQFDIAKEGIFTLINNTDSPYPKITSYPYPKAGTLNARVRLGVVDADSGGIRWTGVEGEPEHSYLARFDWKDAAQLSVVKLNRPQNAAEILLVDAASGKSRVAFRDSSDTWIDVIGDPIWLGDGESVLWITEKDGWRRVLRVNSATGGTTLLTRFDADVAELVGADVSAGILYFTASPTSSTERYLYRARLDGTGAPERVPASHSPGVHQYKLSPGGKWALHTYSRFQTPPITEMIGMADQRATHTLAGNRTLRDKVAPLLQPALEFFQVESEPGVVLDGWMMRPKRFDPSRKYPVVLYVYGEPWSQTVYDEWITGRQQRTMMFHRALADLGFVVVSVDPRGTPALKGTKWRRQIHGAIGPLAAKDYSGAIKRLTEQRPYMDGRRVGVWGRSGGGTSTLNLLFRYPELVHVGVSVAPVPDQRLYDTIYQERYMGTPAGNPKGYAESAIHYAEGLRGRLLLIHGTGDDNVHIQGTELLVNKLVELGKPFDMLVYPNRSHALLEGKGTPYHQFNTMGRYFYEHLKPE
jgi:dipeptidyl-peptidase 4